MLSQIISEGLAFGIQGLVGLGLLYFLHSLWGDLIFIVSGKEKL